MGWGYPGRGADGGGSGGSVVGSGGGDRGERVGWVPMLFLWQPVSLAAGLACQPPGTTWHHVGVGHLPTLGAIESAWYHGAMNCRAGWLGLVGRRVGRIG